MYFLIVEDDHLQATWIEENLGKAFPRARFERIATESDFQSRIKEIVDNPPNVVLMDVMLRWTDPSPNMPQAAQDYQGFHRAGIRCAKLLREHSGTKTIPVVLFTVLEENDLEEELSRLKEVGCFLVRKDSDMDPLVEELRRILHEQ